MKLSIIIVNYNVQFFLDQCILSVRLACNNILAEIIVVDNNSKDNSCEMIRDKYPEVILIANKKNVGFSRANNQGAKIAKGEYLLILNPDTVVGEGTFEKLIDFAETKKDLGAIGVKMIDGMGNFLPESKRNIPTVKIASQKIRGNSKNYYANQIAANHDAKIEILAGAFMWISKKAYGNVNGFDEDYFMYGEDVDLSYKLLNSGYQNYYFGTISIIHYKGESTVKNKAYLKNFYGAMKIFYRKHFKVSFLDNMIVNWGIHLLIWFHSNDHIGHSNKIGNLLLIGNEPILFNKIKLNLKADQYTMEKVLPNGNDFDTVIFDNYSISFSEIIHSFQNIKLQNIKKRIVPSGASFLLGSDSSTNRGEFIRL